MARLRKHNKERPPQTVQVHLTLATHEMLMCNKIEKNEPFYKIVERILSRYQELEFIQQDLKESLMQSRIKRAELERKLEDLTQEVGMIDNR